MYVHSVVMANGLKHRLLTGINQFDHDAYGSNNIIRRAELFNQANGFVSNGSLTLHCEVNIVVGELVKPDLDDQLKDKYSQPEMVTKSMGDLLDSGAHSDVTLVMVHDGGQELRAHKLILVARSRVFADMFQSEMMESVTNRVEVFKQVLHFIYTGTVGTTSLDAIVEDLLVCADKYQLDPLKSICEEHLVSSISSVSNLSDLLDLATLHDVPKLKAKVLNLMRKDIEAQLLDEDKLAQINRLLSSLAIDRKD